MQRRALTAFAAAAAFLAGAPTALAATHYAAVDGASTNWPCTSSQSPCDLATAIQGHDGQMPADGDQVIIEPGTYSLTNVEITAPVPEDIHGISVADEPVIVDSFSSTIGGDYWALAPSEGELTDVSIHVTQSGNNQDTYAAQSLGGTTFDQDFFSSAGTHDNDSAVFVTNGDKLLDTVADALGPLSTAVTVYGYPGTTATLRNVTAFASGTGATALYALDDNPDPPSPCPAGQLKISVVNVIALAPVPLSGQQLCPSSSTAVFDIDYSDYDAADDALSSGIEVSPGAHNINATPVFVNSGSDPFDEEPNSPTVDKGTNDPQDGPLDVDGRARFLGSAPDIGAAELPAPYPAAGTVTGLEQNGAIVNGAADPEGSDLETTVSVQYGTSTSYGSVAPALCCYTIASKSTPIPDPEPFTIGLEGLLSPGTTYDYRIVVSNADGTTYGSNQTFTTPAPVTLRLLRGTTGIGDVTVHGSDDTLHSCQPGCSLQLQTETQYTLTASALSGSTFEGWHIAGCSGTGPCTLTLSGNMTIAPTFAINPPRLSRVSASKHKPKLSFTVTAGRGNLLVALSVALPGDLKLVTSKHGVKLNVKGATATIRHRALRLSLKPGTGAGSLRITLTSPAIRLVKRKHPQLDLTVQATESASGYQTVTRLVHKT